MITRMIEAAKLAQELSATRVTGGDVQLKIHEEGVRIVASWWRGVAAQAETIVPWHDVSYMVLDPFPDLMRGTVQKLIDLVEAAEGEPIRNVGPGL